jgi:hypothetical protein
MGVLNQIGAKPSVGRGEMQGFWGCMLGRFSQKSIGGSMRMQEAAPHRWSDQGRVHRAKGVAEVHSCMQQRQGRA